MADNTQPFFIVSSGRSGTHALYKALSLYDEIDMHHEYMGANTQLVSTYYYMRVFNLNDVINYLSVYFEPSIRHTSRALWGDASNKLSWIILPILKTFPNAKFVWVVRDGRKVVSSYYNKLRDECYTNTNILYEHIKFGKKPPPVEKPYLWPIPTYVKDMSQFELICWHWNEINRFINEQLHWVSPHRQFFCKLEDLIQPDSSTLSKLLHFLNLSYRQDVYDALQVPTNVNVPTDFDLTKDQERTFWNLCSDMMKLLRYEDKEVYTMKYGYQRQDATV